MILRRLYELAEREGLLQDPAFDLAPVACLIQVGEHGEFLGMTDLREHREEPAKRKGGKPKVVIDKGKPMPVPVRPVVLDVRKPSKKQAEAVAPRWKTQDPAAAGQEKPAVFLADTIARVLPVQRLIDEKQRAKFDAQRSTFWRFLDHVANETNDPALRALQQFGEWLRADDSAAETLATEIEAKGVGISQLCTFAWVPDENIGQPVLLRPAVRDWWRAFFAADRASQEADTFRARCQITDAEAAIPSSIKTRINGLVSIGCRADAYLVTALDASESYGLSGAATGMVSAQGVDGFTRALNALIANGLPCRPKTNLRVGGTMFLFWTRNKEPCDLMAFDTPEPEQVARLIRSAEIGRPQYGTSERDFYCLTLSGNSARAVVRDYLEAPLPEVEVNLGHWFRDLEIVDWYSGEKTALFPLWMLANCTVRTGDDVPPDLPTVLMSAALKGTPVPQHVLAACLRRIRLETGVSDDTVRRNCFRPARMGLIQLILRRLANAGEATMNDFSTPQHQGYACGQLLAFLARCQSPRDYGAGAQVLDRYFGSASTAPRSVFPFLLRLNRHHIRKVRDDNPGFAFNLEEELETRLAPFRPSPEGTPDFPAVLSLPEQGRFALGFYHQRAEYRVASLERKAAAQQAGATSGT
jgi:CRISPR-associated protein Csd1